MKMLDVPQSGSIAGQTSSRNRYGQYRRTRAVPVNVNSPAQTDVRASFAEQAQRWKDESIATQDAWNYWAQSHPRLDSLGQTIVMTGFNAYISVNSMLLNAGATVIGTPPGDTVVTPPILTIDDPSLAGPIAIGFTPTPVPASTSYIIFTSPPKTLGVTFNRDFRFVTTIAAAAASPQTIGAALVTKWGTLQAGIRFFVRSYALTVSGGFKGCASALSNIVLLDVVA